MKVFFTSWSQASDPLMKKSDYLLLLIVLKGKLTKKIKLKPNLSNYLLCSSWFTQEIWQQKYSWLIKELVVTSAEEKCKSSCPQQSVDGGFESH